MLSREPVRIKLMKRLSGSEQCTVLLTVMDGEPANTALLFYITSAVRYKSKGNIDVKAHKATLSTEVCMLINCFLFFLHA